MLLQYRIQDRLWTEAEDVPDRGLQFGDGLFETVRLSACGKAPLKDFHLQRLTRGLERLGFSHAASQAALLVLSGLLEGDMSLSESANAFKLMVTRGRSERGYASACDLSPGIYVQFFSAAPVPAPGSPEQLIVVGVNPVRLSRQPLLAGLKHLNRLEQVMARRSFSESWAETLMLDTDNQVIEGCMSNLYFKIDQRWYTPGLSDSGVCGVVRSWLLSQGIVSEKALALSELPECSALAFSNTLTGIRSVVRVDDAELAPDPDVALWQDAFRSLFN